MSLVRRLFGLTNTNESESQPAPQNQPLAQRVTVHTFACDPELIDIRELDFMGNVARSKSKEFAVAFADSCRTADGTRGGFRESGYGTVLLIRHTCVLWQRKIARPTEAAVSDKGDVAVCDVGFGAGLKSTILIFSADGQQRVEQKIKAMLFSCAMTPEGDHAVFNSCASDVDADSIKLFAYSIPSATRLFAADFAIAKITDVACVGDTLTVTADGLNYRYSLDGTLGNETEIAGLCFDRAIASADYVRAYFLLKRRKDDGVLSGETRSFLMDGYARLSACAPNEYRAKCFRDWGQLLLVEGDKRAAADRFRAALGLNPKIGLKRKLAELEKELASHHAPT